MWDKYKCATYNVLAYIEILSLSDTYATLMVCMYVWFGKRNGGLPGTLKYEH